MIKKRRESEGLSLREFSERCNLSHSYIRNLEDGDPRTGKPIVPTIESLGKISAALSMSLEELLKETGYIQDEQGFVPSNLKLIRGTRTYAEICTDITAKTNIIIDPAIYAAVEEGRDNNPSLLFIDTLAKYAGVDRSFFYRKNTIDVFEYAKINTPYKLSDTNRRATPSTAREDGLSGFPDIPDSNEYLKLAMDLFESKIDIKQVRRTFLEN